MTRPAVLRLLQMFDRDACASEERERSELDGVCQSLRREAADPASAVAGDERRGTGTASCERADVIDAMRAALAERTDGSPMHEMALVLVRSGVVDRDTTACLEPWRQSPFLWKQRALTAGKINEFLMLHGFRPMTPVGASVVDAAIGDPLSAVEDTWRLWPAMFGRQLVECPLDAGMAQPRADRLLADLAAAARPAIALTEVKQALARDRWRVTFRCLGSGHGFYAAQDGNRLDVDAVMSAFNALMAQLAHPCRAFRIDRPVVPEGGSAASPATAHLIVTRAVRFEAAARAIGIPLVQAAGPTHPPRALDEAPRLRAAG